MDLDISQKTVLFKANRFDRIFKRFLLKIDRLAVSIRLFLESCDDDPQLRPTSYSTNYPLFRSIYQSFSNRRASIKSTHVQIHAGCDRAIVTQSSVDLVEADVNLTQYRYELDSLYLALLTFFQDCTLLQQTRIRVKCLQPFKVTRQTRFTLFSPITVLLRVICSLKKKKKQSPSEIIILSSFFRNVVTQKRRDLSRLPLLFFIRGKLKQRVISHGEIWIKNYRWKIIIVCAQLCNKILHISRNFPPTLASCFPSRNRTKQKNLFQENHTQDISHRHHRETARRTNTRLSQREIQSAVATVKAGNLLQLNNWSGDGHCTVHFVLWKFLSQRLS